MSDQDHYQSPCATSFHVFTSFHGHKIVLNKDLCWRKLCSGDNYFFSIKQIE